jgi:hypothetical protein
LGAEDRKHIHGNDEGLQIAAFGKFVQFLYTATVDLACARQPRLAAILS